MTKKQYISHLVSEKEPLLGKDIPQESRAVVIDGLREIISDKDILLAEREKQIANLQKQNEYFKRMLFGRKSEKLHPDDPSQLTLDFGEETVMPLTTEELKEAEDRVNSKLEEVRKNAEQRRSDKKTQSSRKGKEYRIPSDIERDTPIFHYPEGYSEETHEVIGWTTHEYLEMEKSRFHVRVEKEAVCKPKGTKAGDSGFGIQEAKGAQNCLQGR